MTELYILHGRNSNPSKCWFPWLAEEARNKGINVHVPELPNPYLPKAEKWINKISETAREPSPDKFFVTHSLRGLALLKYFGTLNTDEQYGGAVMVAPFQEIDLKSVKEKTSEKLSSFFLHIPGFIKNRLVKKSVKNSIEWTKDKIDWEKAKKACKEYRCLFFR